MLFYILIFIRTLYVHYGRFSLLLGYSTVSLRPWRKVSDRPYNSSFSSTSPTLPELTYPHQNISKRSKKGVPAPAISHLWENIHQKEDIKRSLSLYGTVHFLPLQHASHTSQKTLLCFHCKKKKKIKASSLQFWRSHFCAHISLQCRMHLYYFTFFSQQSLPKMLLFSE